MRERKETKVKRKEEKPITIYVTIIKLSNATKRAEKGQDKRTRHALGPPKVWSGRLAGRREMEAVVQRKSESEVMFFH